MLIKQFIPNRNFVLLKRTHEMIALELRAKDPNIPVAHTIEVIAKGSQADSTIGVGTEVYMTPNPYEMFFIDFEDNDKDIFKIKKQIMAPTQGSLIVANSEAVAALPKPGEKVTFVTYVMVQDRDIVATVLPYTPLSISSSDSFYGTISKTAE